MTLQEATERAIGMSILTQKYVYVTRENNDYSVATDRELDSYWHIAEVVLTATPAGEVYERRA